MSTVDITFHAASTQRRLAHSTCPNLSHSYASHMFTPAEVVESAVCFFKAMTLYRDQMELLMLLQRSVPENVMTLLYGLVGTEVQRQQQQQAGGGVVDAGDVE